MTATIHPQTLVPQRVFDYVATVIRRDQMDGEDLHDVVFAVDNGEDIPVVGAELFVDLAVLSAAYKVSAQFLVDEAAVCLGWSLEVSL